MPHQRTKNSLTAAEIGEVLRAEMIGDGNRVVCGVEFIQRAQPSDLAFISSAKYLGQIAVSKSQVIIAPQICKAQLEITSDRTFLLVREPESSFLHVAGLLLPRRVQPRSGISDRAAVASTAVIGANTTVQPFAAIGEDVTIGENCHIGFGVVIGDGCVIGDNVQLDPHVVLYSDVIIGSNVIIHANTVVGADGFGYRTVNGRHERLPHFGTVRICDDVEIGGCTTIDRAKMGETVIGEGTKIDNMVVVAHNCRIGKHNLLVSQTGIAGSSSTGAYVVCAGQSGIADHVHLGDGAIVGAKSGVHKDLPGGQSYLGSPARPATEHAREILSLKHLPTMREAIRSLEKQMTDLQKQKPSDVHQAGVAVTPDRSAA